MRKIKSWGASIDCVKASGPFMIAWRDLVASGERSREELKWEAEFQHGMLKRFLKPAPATKTMRIVAPKPETMRTLAVKPTTKVPPRPTQKTKARRAPTRSLNNH